MSKALLVLSAVVVVGTWSTIGPAGAQNAAAGKSVFRSQCSICHSVRPRQNLIGPSLAGIVGQRAGAVPGFRFTAAMKNSRLTWDAATLNRYLANPAAVVPGTAMTYPGLKNAEKRANLIAYLETVR